MFFFVNRIVLESGKLTTFKANWMSDELGSDRVINVDFKRNTDQKIVIVLTQVRSGSSFTANLLTYLPRTFFSSEPLRTFLNYTFPNESTNKSMESTFISDILNCHIDYHEMYVNNLKGFSNRVYEDYERQPLLLDGHFISYLCKRSMFHVIKMVAVKLSDLLKFLEDSELNIYVIHLLRDPRASLNSVRNILTEDFLHTPDYYCNNIRRDLKTSEILKRKYPNR